MSKAPLSAAAATVIAVLLLSPSAFAATPTAPAAAALKPDPALSAAVADPARRAEFRARDGARHPVEALGFFGLAPTLNVVELSPGGGYWTEILGPYLKARGTYTVALPAPVDDYSRKSAATWRERYAAQPARFGKIRETLMGKGHADIAPAGSADLVLTFRNLHNWMEDGTVDQVLAACFRALKPGGILGVEGHRGRADQPQDPKAESGYVRQDYAIDLARKAGFEFVGASETNANPKDTKDWPKGVWTLPPTLTLGDQDRARYVAIGEADNFVLKFRKPAK